MNKQCTRCKGTGESRHEAFTSLDGVYYPERVYKCSYCEGKGEFEPPNVQQILAEIKGRKGLRSARPKSSRSYYVWRMARFHGGADVTMPICASIDNAGDPFIDVLDIIADKVAKHVYGTDNAAAFRWGNALGYNMSVPDGMPASAYSCGPVADGNKPEEEMMELR